MAQDRQERQENQDLPVLNIATSEICTQTGPYRSSSIPPVILFIFRAQPFPNAPTSTSASGAPTSWTLLTAALAPAPAS
jgi:hypothetical protein